MCTLIVRLEFRVGIENLEARLASLKNSPVRLVDVIESLPLGPVVFPADGARGEWLQHIPMNEANVVPENVLRFEELQTDAAAQTEDLPVQAEDVHLKFNFTGEKVGTELANEGIGVVHGMRSHVLLIAQNVRAFGTEKVAGWMTKADVGNDFTFALHFFIA